MTLKEKKDELFEKVSRMGISSLEDKELVMLTIICSPSKSSYESKSKMLLDMMNIYEADYDKFTRFGFKEDEFIPLLAAQEIGRRYAGKKNIKTAITCPKDAYDYTRHYAYEDQEQLIVLGLNGAHEIKFSKVATKGLVNMTVVHPREVLSDAILHRCSALMILHNHPSGINTPSDEDKNITKRIKEASIILGINLLDHIIICRDSYFSFKENDLL